MNLFLPTLKACTWTHRVYQREGNGTIASNAPRHHCNSHFKRVSVCERSLFIRCKYLVYILPFLSVNSAPTVLNCWYESNGIFLYLCTFFLFFCDSFLAINNRRGSFPKEEEEDGTVEFGCIKVSTRGRHAGFFFFYSRRQERKNNRVTCVYVNCSRSVTLGFSL